MRKENILLVMLVFMLMIMIGSTLNFIIKENNDCLMPVHSQYVYEGDDKHFFYQDFDEVNYPYLSDILNYEVGKYIHFFSIGDLIMVLGLSGLITCAILYLRIKNSERKNIKNAD